MTAEQFIVGVDNIPAWMNEAVQKGLAHILYEGDSKAIKEIEINTPLKVYKAHRGDVVLMLPTGITVLPKRAAKRYGEQPTKKSF